ncbi:hypothetical protein [Patiriisocius marinus]|uniref:Uncharacterized protein n=1 Tax=Patiriisocius marinus TaxID=1397112 RepID=A0A5J4IXE5_9FLAO|nr:hypothetical protein [Patiriisocius marinus]GER59634.1 hypothetical protein ULMA_17420 [Patiriisocius marinus]
MIDKQQDLPKFIKDTDNQKEENYILQDNKKTKFGATFIIIIVAVLILAVVASSMFITWE